MYLRVRGVGVSKSERCGCICENERYEIGEGGSVYESESHNTTDECTYTSGILRKYPYAMISHPHIIFTYFPSFKLHSCLCVSRALQVRTIRLM